ncbi:MAG TPA: hypothetical protein VLF69_05825 [Candidatus Saccharimonadales bacterium]|nr:hypothetical protein [Candidatus Saccharimonadales bacterium]
MAEKDSTGYTPEKPANGTFKMPIGLLQAHVAVRQLERYMALVTLYMERFLDDTSLDTAPPIGKLIKNYDEKKRRNLLRRELCKLSDAVNKSAKRAGVQVRYRRGEGEKEVGINIFLDFFNVPESERHIQYNTTRTTVYRAIGVYQRERLKGLWNIINPVYWLSVILNVPVHILSRAGIDVETSRTYKMHYWILQSLMAILLIFLIYKIGVPTNFLTMVQSAL